MKLKTAKHLESAFDWLTFILIGLIPVIILFVLNWFCWPFRKLVSLQWNLAARIGASLLLKSDVVESGCMHTSTAKGLTARHAWDMVNSQKKIYTNYKRWYENHYKEELR